MKLFLPRGLGLSLVKVRTRTQLQKYVVNWKDLERAFPAGLSMGNPSEQWDYMVNEYMGPQGTKDPELWNHIQQFRSSIGQPRRLVRDKCITTAFVDFVVDQLIAETSVFGDFKYHDGGTGVGGEVVGDTALGTPTGEARSEGTQAETDHNTYKSVATDTYAGTFAITEHGLLNASSAGTLMDRTVFSAINVVSGNQIEFTFEASFTAGS